ncbi:DNA topoisomerase IV [Siphonobacter sp. BAB-5385]|uniref:DNA topoisomerase (ATP-hydrolyzing) n=1 Tax=Siphonobacter curvatus TaxID=2094562 RepID=A0A2S7IQT4_9BACT|nr:MULTISPECIES: DNA topoisomerase IV subunit B [Siphonobacter]OZI05256.1 DNA topoisomerase IV [Siphonobacter sp. BAB-5385]PQA60075.1 type IIA DNA topoisomerase subunit B [Siphonobacter curvatus]
MAEQKLTDYTEDSIRSLDWKEHIRLRPGMYIGKLGDGSSADDGIYVLVKEVIDNCIDEHVMGFGKTIEVKIAEHRVEVRDYGRGIPLGKVIDVVSKINTGGKYDSGAFQKSVGLNGVGTKAVNALSAFFRVQSVRDGQAKWAEFSKGELVRQSKGTIETKERNGTHVVFEPDNTVFKNYHFIPQYLENQIWNYAYLNAGLTIQFNGQKYIAQRGLLDLLERKTDPDSIRYPIIHLKGNDIEIAMTHGNQYGEEYYSFVNGQNTTMGGTHLAAFKEAVVKTAREFFKKDYAPEDIRASISAAVSLRVQEPVFESQTKTKLGSTNMSPDTSSPTVRGHIVDFLKTELDNFLHKNPAVAEAMKKRIEQSERERKEIAGIKKLANDRAKKASVHNKKLRDCRIHLPDAKAEDRLETTLFITEGDSASGSITKSRNVQTQAVFSLRGKPLNCFGLTKKIVYENEEFNLLQHALDIEAGLDTLRFNRIVIATDADVDGMHIRLLLLTFFLQFFPDIVRNGHLYILETPLFRVRNPKKHEDTIYCYSEEEKQKAIARLSTNGRKVEITRFKGLGEISPDEFGKFIGEDMRLEPVILEKESTIPKLLSYYMGKNTPDRQRFIIDNLIIEKDDVEEILEVA